MSKGKSNKTKKASKLELCEKLKQMRWQWLAETRAELTAMATRMVRLKEREKKLLEEIQAERCGTLQ